MNSEKTPSTVKKQNKTKKQKNRTNKRQTNKHKAKTKQNWQIKTKIVLIRRLVSVELFSDVSITWERENFWQMVQDWPVYQNFSRRFMKGEVV